MKVSLEVVRLVPQERGSPSNLPVKEIVEVVRLVPLERVQRRIAEEIVAEDNVELVNSVQPEIISLRDGEQIVEVPSSVRVTGRRGADVALVVHFKSCTAGTDSRVDALCGPRDGGTRARCGQP